MFIECFSHHNSKAGLNKTQIFNAANSCLRVCDADSFETKASVLLSWLIDQTLNVFLDKVTVMIVFHGLSELFLLKVTLRAGKSFDLDFADTVVYSRD